MKNKKLKLAIIVADDNPFHFVGLAANAPMPDILMAMLEQVMTRGEDLGGVVEFVIKKASEMGLVRDGGDKRPECGHDECVRDWEERQGKKAGKMDPALRARSECPATFIKPEQGELGAMLSILSDKLAKGGR